MIFFQTGFKVDESFESSVEYSFESTLSLKWKNLNKFGENIQIFASVI